MTRAQKIIAIATSYIGQQEVQPNQSFKDPSFLAKMIARGWKKGQAWCSYFAKQCYVEAYADNPRLLPVIKSCGSGGAANTLENYKGDGTFTISKIPVPGAIAIFKDGKGPLGHAAIVTSVSGITFLTVEGNTNTDGSRDGYEVAAKSHQLNQPFKAKGLNLVAFIIPIED
jgi:surface antigen